MKKILMQLLKFLGISGIGWIIDFIIYLTISTIFKIDLDIANMISSLVGVSFVFIMSNKKIFINANKIPLKWKYIIYIVYQVVLIYLASKVILILENELLTLNIDLITKYINAIVKVLITPFTMIINFIVVKYLIEKL